MQIYIASDHAGFALKEKIIAHLAPAQVVDCGPRVFDRNDDYPDFVAPVAQKVASDRGSMGIVIGASGQGEAMVANRVKGARAAVYYGEPSANQTDESGHILNLIQSARAHNDANILSIGARFVSEFQALSAVDLFLQTSFSGEERHARRIAKLDSHES